MSSQAPRSYTCPDSTCGQTFANLDTFHGHWKDHRIQCPFPSCETRIGSKHNFGRHCARAHGDHFIDYRSVEETACKHHCGKSYSKADISNLRRHEKTCCGHRAHRQPRDTAIRVNLVAVDVTSSTDQDFQHGITSGAVRNLGQSSDGETFQHSLSPGRQTSLRAPGNVGYWRDSRPIVDAVETLQHILAGGPAADAFQAFTRFLGNLGYPSQIPNLSGLEDSNEVCERPLAEQSDQIVDLDDTQQGSYENGAPEVSDRAIPDSRLVVSRLQPIPKRRLDTDEADISQSLPKRVQLALHHESNEKFMAGSQEDVAKVVAQVCFTCNFVRSGTLIVVKGICLLWLGGPTALEQADTSAMTSLHLRNPMVVPTAGFCRWTLSILSSAQLHPNILRLALLLTYRLVETNRNVKSKAGSECRILLVALMSAEKLYEDEPHSNRFWAEASGIALADIFIMEMEFLSNVKYSLFVSIEQMSEWSEKLVRLLELHDKR
jgi:hypothetical protein